MKINNFLPIFLLTLCFGAGFLLAHMSPGGSGKWFAEQVLGAQHALYRARTGVPGEPMQYFVYASDFAALEEASASDPDILAFEETLLPGLATVTLATVTREPYDRVRRLEGVESVIQVPDFCH